MPTKEAQLSAVRFGRPRLHALVVDRQSRIGRIVQSQSCRSRGCIWNAALLGALLLSGCVLTESGLDLRDELANVPQDSGVAPVIRPTTASQNELLPSPVEWDEGQTASVFVQPVSPDGYRDVSLDEAIQFALSNSTVLRDLGGRLIQAPVLTPTIYGPSIQATDPRFGIEAALSEFDAQFTTRTFFEKNDRVLNNELLGGGVNYYRQDLWRTQSEISKKAATGTQMFLRHNVEDDLNNATRNLFQRAWNWNLETEVRQPLLQGSGVLYNRIAGRSDSPGVANGVMIARVNMNISEADFQMAIRDFVSNVENAYWDLYFAYRDLHAKKKARDRSLETWRDLKSRPDVAADRVEQALEQYYRVKEDVENALTGRLVEGSRSFNGSGGGSFQSVGGVRVAERRLRLLMGLPVDNDGILRPNTEPPSADVVFDPDDAAGTAVQRRAELRAQQLRTERRRLELIADQNFLRPQLDLVARYRWRGLGDNLYDPNAPDMGESRRSNTHEWLVGAEFSQPLGFRQAHSAVRNSQLRLARERALLAEMERQVFHDLQNAITNKDRAYSVMQIAFNRRRSAQRRYDLLTDKKLQEANKTPDFNLILDADRRLLEAETSYHRTRVDYALALKNVHFEMGALLDYCNVQLADDAMPVGQFVTDVAQGSAGAPELE